MPRIEAAVRSHIGRVRKNNEDNFYLNGVAMRADQCNAGGLFQSVNDGKRQLYAVCDGMGGMNRGEEASLRAVTDLNQLLTVSHREFPKSLQAYIEETSRALQSLDTCKRTSGSTLALLHLDGSYVRIANLGDSRVYFKRGMLALTQITDDHSQAEWYEQQGILSHTEAAVHSSRNILRRYLGAPLPEGRMPNILDAMRIRRNDIFILCSDGLSGLVSTHEIDTEACKDLSCAGVCKALTSMALERGGTDNITVMMVKVL